MSHMQVERQEAASEEEIRDVDIVADKRGRASELCSRGTHPELRR